MAVAGRLIALEGIDGCGKSTQARLLAEALGARLTFEPGDGSLGRALRALLLEPDLPAPSARAEALLMSADRAQHVAEVLRPALGAGEWVVTDRYAASTLAYQGFGRGLAMADLQALVAFAADGLVPDMTVVVDVPVAVGRSRHVGAPDRLEGLGDDFHERVRAGYLAMAADDAERWVVIDGTAPVDAVAAAVLQAVTARLGRPGSSPT